MSYRVFISSVGFFSLIHAPNQLVANSNNPPNGYHGETMNCTSCHSGSGVNTGDGGISVSGLPSSYVPGQTYDLSLTVNGTNSNGFGFQFMPKSLAGASGSLTAVSSDMGIESNAAEHRGRSSDGSWSFQWTAPATDEGEVIFYASGLATGGSSGSWGDSVYTWTERRSAQATPVVVPFPHASADWNSSTGGVIFSSAAVDSSGSIYFGSNDNKLYALNADGSSKWTFSSGNWIDSTPAIGSDGTLYVGSWDNKVYALNSSNGTKLWEYETNSFVTASPSLGADGRIYVGSKDSIFYAFENNGSVAWEYFAGQPISSSAALGQDGTIYFGDENGTFHAVNPDGSSKWTYLVDEVTDTNRSIFSSPALDFSGNIYFGAGNGYCYSLSDNENNATLNWSFLTGDRVDASPVLGMDNEVIFVSRDGYMRSLSTLAGGLNWEAFVGDVFYSSPVVDANGRVYVIGYTGSGENHLFAYDKNGSKAWDTNDTDCPFEIEGIVDSSLVISDTGKLIYGCYDNYLYSLDLGIGPASSDWPMFQRNTRRDGAWPSYSVEITVSPTGIGDVNGSGVYNQGANAVLTPYSTISGYSFNNWSGAYSGSDNPLTLEINSNLSLTANFSLNSYLLSTSADSGGTVSEGASFNHGILASISATPNTGYSFSGWSGSGITDASAASTTVDMTEARTVSASFSIKSYSINSLVSPQGTGSVTGSGTYSHGDSITLTATPNTSFGYSFVNWSGSTSSVDNPLVLEINSDLNITANFELKSYNLTLIAETGGTVEGGGTNTHGTLAPVSAIPDPGYTFTGWTGDGISDPNASSTTINMTQARSATASFSISSYSLVISSGSGGTTSGSDNYKHNSMAIISATPELGYSFVSWSGEGITDSTSASTTVLMSENRSISAVFAPMQNTLSISTIGQGSASGDGNYSYGHSAIINAVPSEGYIFSHWTGDGIVESNHSSTTVLMNQDRSISAVFSEKPPDIKVLILTSSPTSGGTTTGSGSYTSGQTATLTASPSNGYTFSHWSGGSSGMDLNSTSLTISEDLNITAFFTANFYTLNVFASTSGGTVSGSGDYEFGSTALISAIPSAGFSFSGWTGDSISDPLLTDTTITVSGDQNLTASFSPNFYSLSLIAGEGGTVQGSGSYAYGTSATIHAVPSEGYRFSGWSGSSLLNSGNSSTTIEIFSDLQITASFEALSLTNLGGSNSLEANWYSSSWLGYFYTTGSGWCYHLNLGWIYPVIREDGQLWIWSPQLEWLWVSESSFTNSFAWSFSSGNWIFFNFDSSLPMPRIFDYGTETWNLFDKNTEQSQEDSLF